MSYIYPRIGPSFQSDNTCTFTVWAPLKNKVSLVLFMTDGEEVIDMECDERGFWSATVTGVGPGTRYKFQLEGRERYPDPA